ncbi:MAG TPA: ABC transporter permease [Ktedonobacteraceae bacterium]|nr:ABC transporter permease [Ktedonobacteraceae bacterium]
MVQFLVKRFIGLIFVVIGVTFITFILGYFAPGDPIRELLGNHFIPSVYKSLKHSYGLDLPWYTQYWNFLTHLFRLDFGFSFHQQNYPVWNILRDGVPVSAELAFWALILQLLVGIPIGIISALKANTWVDTVNMGLMLVMYALPSFVLAIFAQVVIVWLDNSTGGTWPVAGWGNAWQYSWSDIQFRIAPILVFAAVGTALFARITRTSMLEVLRQDYVRTARAKGLRERVVVYRHAFRNAMIPLVTIFGLSIGLLVTGAFFIETIFNIPGIGQQTIISITNRDYPVIQATVVLLAVAVVVGNLISDILYSIVDPRIKAE